MSDFDDIMGGSTHYHDSKDFSKPTAPPAQSQETPTNTRSNKPKWGDKEYKPIPEAEFAKPPILPVAVILDRGLPGDVVQRLSGIMKHLSMGRFLVRTGHSGDSQVDKGILPHLGHNSQIILPWKSFSSEDYMPAKPEVSTFMCKRLAAMFHKGWFNLKAGAQAFNARDVCILTGPKTDSRALALLMWSEDGAERIEDITDKSKYYRFRMDVCAAHDIIIYNLANKDAIERLKRHLSLYAEVTRPPHGEQHD